MMNTNTKSVEKFSVTGDWAKQSSLLKKKFPHLTNEDVKFEKGREEELLTRLQSRLSKNREGVIEIIQGVEAVAQPTTL